MTLQLASEQIIGKLHAVDCWIWWGFQMQLLPIVAKMVANCWIDDVFLTNAYFAWFQWALSGSFEVLRDKSIFANVESGVASITSGHSWSWCWCQCWCCCQCWCWFWCHWCFQWWIIPWPQLHRTALRALSGFQCRSFETISDAHSRLPKSELSKDQQHIICKTRFLPLRPWGSPRTLGLKSVCFSKYSIWSSNSNFEPPFPFLTFLFLDLFRRWNMSFRAGSVVRLEVLGAICEMKHCQVGNGQLSLLYNAPLIAPLIGKQ